MRKGLFPVAIEEYFTVKPKMSYRKIMQNMYRSIYFMNRKPFLKVLLFLLFLATHSSSTNIVFLLLLLVVLGRLFVCFSIFFCLFCWIASKKRESFWNGEDVFLLEYFFYVSFCSSSSSYSEQMKSRKIHIQLTCFCYCCDNSGGL